MAREQNLFELEAHYENDGDPLLKQKLSPISASTEISDNETSGYDCNICLDSAHDPVVTLCGHLFCWACIYKWFHVETSTSEADKPEQNCPVCKANISLTSLIPLYGRGTSSSDSESKKHNLGVVVPRRPPPTMLNTSISSTTTSATHPSMLNTSIGSTTMSTTHRTPQLHPDLFQSQAHSSLNPQYLTHHYGGYAALATSSLGGMATISFVNPLMGMFGGVVLERIFGSSVTSLSMYPSPHPLMTSSNRRIRRQEVEIDKSLNRVSIFLFCCLILCLLLF